MQNIKYFDIGMRITIIQVYRLETKIQYNKRINKIICSRAVWPVDVSLISIVL